MESLPEDHSALGDAYLPKRAEIDPLKEFDSYAEDNTLYLGDGRQVWAVRGRDVAGEDILFSECVGPLSSQKYDGIKSSEGFDGVVGYLESDFAGHDSEEGFFLSPAEESSVNTDSKTVSADKTVSNALNNF